ncbi:DUF3606 domain-containing protein [Variovorax sp. JS1663]|uniref:DUF3606 domain-containing protein n=1 Tax=Variovorax sp. JS1663 TaxID=1851577 RepID=UPI000B341504|nr:DUF3606 domain-containing protein [Variovorax sp. JS1663]OUM04230.1 hypothetical protein A8M77_00505 [Variovorax sp. JS1663]
MKKPSAPADGPRGAALPERIDISTDRALDKWCRQLDVTHDQLREAVRAVGSRASDIEWHLKAGRGTPLASVRKAGASA